MEEYIQNNADEFKKVLEISGFEIFVFHFVHSYINITFIFRAKP
jgi:hypothetical protein